MDKPQCPICGKEIDDEEYACLENGTPAHFKCAEEKRKKLQIQYGDFIKYILLGDDNFIRTP